MTPRILEAKTKRERVQTRKQLGSLKSLTVQPATKARYEKARAGFYRFLKKEGLAIPASREKLDDLLADYLEHLWSSGQGKGVASDTVAGLQDLDPKLRGSLQVCWHLLKAWASHEIPNRTPPFPEVILHALAGRAFFLNDETFGLSLLVAFYGMLRTGELLGLDSSKISMNGPTQPAIISLGFTKAGQRQGAAESVTITVLPVLRLLWEWLNKCPPRTSLCPAPHKWRKKFQDYLEALHLEGWEFRPYSLRRGGATFWWGKHGSLDKLLISGRWTAIKTARLYINEGVATLAEMSIPTRPLVTYVSQYTTAHQRLGRKLERTLTSSQGGRGRVQLNHQFFPFQNSSFIKEVLEAWGNLGLARSQGALRVPLLFSGLA